MPLSWRCRSLRSQRLIAPARPEGSFSKLNTWRDGFRILGTILKLYRSEKPLRFFTAIGIFLTLVSIGLAIPVIVTYLEEGIVPRLPTAVLSMGLMILAVLSVSSGLVLDTVTRGTPRDQAARLFVPTRCGHTLAAYIMNSTRAGTYC
jgi:hypothetical protein